MFKKTCCRQGILDQAKRHHDNKDLTKQTPNNKKWSKIYDIKTIKSSKTILSLSLCIQDIGISNCKSCIQVHKKHCINILKQNNNNNTHNVAVSL